MPPTTGYSLGDVVLVLVLVPLPFPFPFTDQSGVKKRPAVVVSSARYHADRRDALSRRPSAPLQPPWSGSGSGTLVLADADIQTDDSCSGCD